MTTVSAPQRFTSANHSDELNALGQHVEQLQQALRTRAAIEQAKGMLMHRFGVDADSAFALLTRWSQQHNVKLHRVATDVVELVVARSQAGEPVLDLEAAVTARVSGQSVTPSHTS